MTTPPTLTASVYVLVGGGAGAWLRFMAGRLIPSPGFPFATLAVNVVGSFAMGLLAGWLARHGEMGEPWRLLLGVGVLGGFTTFSAFSLELALMIQRDAVGAAAGYVLLSLAGGVLGLFAGLALMRGAAA